VVVATSERSRRWWYRGVRHCSERKMRGKKEEQQARERYIKRGKANIRKENEEIINETQ
jgi:ribosomal protein S13